MKLLIADMRGHSSYVTRERFETLRTLIRSHGWKLMELVDTWRARRPLAAQIEARFGRLPSVLVLVEGYAFAIDRRSELAALPCPKFASTIDLHERPGRDYACQRAAFELMEGILTNYGPVFDAFFPELGRRVHWVPHGAGAPFLQALDPAPEDRLFLSGAINRAYPLRQRLLYLGRSGRHPITHQPHPGYRRCYDHAKDPEVGVAFAKRIARHRAAFTDASVYRYLVAKYFEITATGSLLLADDRVADQFADLGYEPWKHYVPASEETLIERLHDVLAPANRPAIDRIRARGRELTHRANTIAHRAAEIDRICSTAA